MLAGSAAHDGQSYSGGTMTLSAPLQDFVRTVECLVARELALPTLLDSLAQWLDEKNVEVVY